VKISIVTISFNQGRFLEQAIGSVLDQDYEDTEYIVVDPGSTDCSREIIEKYCARISTIIFERDRGPSDGLRKGFAHATGEIYGYINADDYFEPGTFQHVSRFFGSRPDIDVLCGAVRIVDRDGRARLRTAISDRFDLKRYIAGACWIGQQGTFFRRRAFERAGGFNPENRTCWDGELLVNLALSKCTFAVRHRIFGNFRIHEESLTGSGRLYREYLKDRERIARLVAGRNASFRPSLAFIHRLAHKTSVVRHLRSLAVR